MKKKHPAFKRTTPQEFTIQWGSLVSAATLYGSLAYWQPAMLPALMLPALMSTQIMILRYIYLDRKRKNTAQTVTLTNPSTSFTLGQNLTEISQQYGLKSPPPLLVTESETMRCATDGHCIYISDKLLKNCTSTELRSIISHELAHIDNNHTHKKAALKVLWTTMLCGGLYNIDKIKLNETSELSPIFFGLNNISSALLLCWVSIGAVSLLDKANSYNQEYQADRLVVASGEDPYSLSSILCILELEESVNNPVPLQHPKGKLQRLWSQTKRTLLSRHPQTEKRIERLWQMTEEKKKKDLCALSPQKTKSGALLRVLEWANAKTETRATL